MGRNAARKEMGTPGTKEADLYSWAVRQAGLLRAGKLSEIDPAAIAEEIDDVGEAQYHRLESEARPAPSQGLGPNFSKTNQGNPRKTKEKWAWIFLDFFVRFGAFQWVTGDSTKKFQPLRARAPTAPPWGESQLARTPASPSMPTSLSLPPPRRFAEQPTVPWASTNVKNIIRTFARTRLVPPEIVINLNQFALHFYRKTRNFSAGQGFQPAGLSQSGGDKTSRCPLGR